MSPAYDKSVFETQIEHLVTTDPGLPRANPTESFWQQPPHPVVSSIQSAALPEKTDIVVIGSGATACSVTKSLLEEPAFQGTHVTVLEARTLVSGATGRNGGHLVSPVGHRFSELVASHGLEAAKEISRFSLKTIERVQEVAAGLSPDLQEYSEVRPVDKVAAVASPSVWEHHQASLAAFNKAVPERSKHHRLLSKEELAKDWGLTNVLGGIVQKSGALWPYRLFTGIFQDLLTRFPDRLSIETKTPVLSITKASDRDSSEPSYIVETSRGTIRANKVIYCTNAYTPHLLPRLRGKIYPLRGHMTTQAPGPRFPDWNGKLSWSFMEDERLDPVSGHFHFGLYYLQQNAKTGDIFAGVENQLISDGLSSDDTFISDISEKDLSSLLPRFFSAYEGAPEEQKPQLKAIWSGIMGMTSDGVPLVGQLPQSITGREVGNEWIAAGFNGYGMDKCWLTGEALVAMMAGKDVSSWFPSAYLISEDRLRKKMDMSDTIKMYTELADDSIKNNVKL